VEVVVEYWYADERSGTRYPGDPLRRRGDDGAPLTVSPLPGLAPDDVGTGVRSLRRYRAALPGDLWPVPLGEGRTPPVPRPRGDGEARFKLEWFSPTGSSKDRGSSVVVSALAGAVLTGSGPKAPAAPRELLG
jgi:threonine synthase